MLPHNSRNSLMRTNYIIHAQVIDLQSQLYKTVLFSHFGCCSDHQAMKHINQFELDEQSRVINVYGDHLRNLSTIFWTSCPTCWLNERQYEHMRGTSSSLQVTMAMIIRALMIQRNDVMSNTEPQCVPRDLRLYQKICQQTFLVK